MIKFNLKEILGQLNLRQVRTNNVLPIQYNILIETDTQLYGAESWATVAGLDNIPYPIHALYYSLCGNISNQTYVYRFYGVYDGDVEKAGYPLKINFPSLENHDKLHSFTHTLDWKVTDDAGNPVYNRLGSHDCFTL